MRRTFALAAAVAACAGLAVPASAQLGPLLVGKKGSKKISEDVFEVTARGNNMRERRSSLTMALRKAAARAAKQDKAWIAVLREKSGTWSMGGRAIGDETTIRVRMLDREQPVLDQAGAPARLYLVADLLAGPS
jgi:hypothetical protein